MASADGPSKAGLDISTKDINDLGREDRFKDELRIHLAKSTLDSGAKLLDRLASTVASVSGTLLAAYVAALGFLRSTFESYGQMIPVAIPAAIWLVTLPVSLFLTLPHKERFDLKISSKIADAGSRGLARQLRWAKTVLFLMLVGIGFAIGVILSFEQKAPTN
ncbi:MAG: hypothetical protein JO121_21400 [Deltaproteobacteria bacterium]|nr:hypothetical protein [Deltaproteobacteria bacterium]